ncbi:MAG TPA: hypothetical protein VGR34_06140 [Candidatus Dormibacteraeota bacterium]|nr:hypothetical protein [Candidatus Dormibacteraeota bacterium]
MSIPVSFTFFAGLNGQYLEWGPVIDGTTDNVTPPTYLNSLTGNASLYDALGVVVLGFNAIVFAYVAASNGIYRAPLGGTFNPPVGKGYVLKVDLAGAPGGPGHWEVPAAIVMRSTT